MPMPSPIASQSTSGAPLQSGDAEDIPDSSSVEQEEEAQLDTVGSEPLTLIYKGEQFSFKDVEQEQLTAILMLLKSKARGEKPDSAVPGNSTQVTKNSKDSQLAPVDNKDIGNNTSPTHNQNRQASLMRFREKKRCRTFNKKIRYEVRKQVAKRMVRVKGRFAPFKQEDTTA